MKQIGKFFANFEGATIADSSQSALKKDLSTPNKIAIPNLMTVTKKINFKLEVINIKFTLPMG